MTTKFFRDASGNYIGAFGPNVPAPVGGIEVATAPDDARQKWNAGAWQPLTQSDMDAQAEIDATTAANRKELKALALVIADLHGLTPTEIRQLYKDKFKTL